MEQLQGANMAFITAGMGGGTGTGAAPVIARAAREMGVLTVAVVTKPFHFEGMHRMSLAEAGIEELQQVVDTLIIIPNQNLFRVANEKTTFADAFNMADEVLHSGVRGVTDLMVMPGMINLDFADIRSVMSEMGKAMMGTGEAEGENRAIAAAEAAISNPLLEDLSMRGARGILINITGGMDMTLFEVDEAANRIRDEVDPDANIIFGSTFQKELEGRIRISVVATGIESEAAAQPRPQMQTLVGKGGRVMSLGGNPATAPTLVPMLAPTMQRPAAAPMSAAMMAPTPAMPMADPALVVHGTMAMAPAPQAEFEPAVPQDPYEMAAGATMAAEQAPVFAPQSPAQRPPAARPAVAPAPAPAAVAPARRAMPNLFTRATSTIPAWSKREPTSTPATPVVATPAPAAPTPAPAEQPRLALDPEVRLSPSQAAEDLLDIPAFLRRQAN
jgi:cell division protein FtsZ